MSVELSGPLNALLETMVRFELGEMPVEVLQAAVRSAEDGVTEHELRDLRRFLKTCEGKLELLRFTVDGAHLFAEALKVVEDVRSQFRRVFEVP